MLRGYNLLRKIYGAKKSETVQLPTSFKLCSFKKNNNSQQPPSCCRATGQWVAWPPGSLPARAIKLRNKTELQNHSSGTPKTRPAARSALPYLGSSAKQLVIHLRNNIERKSTAFYRVDTIENYIIKVRYRYVD